MSHSGRFRLALTSGCAVVIVAALVSAHGGAVWVQSEYGQGAKFSVALPLAPEAISDRDEGDLPEEDAEVEMLGWNDDPAAEDLTDPQEFADPEADDPPDVSGHFHGATAWQGPLSSSRSPNPGGDT